jgi:hypothetical protein
MTRKITGLPEWRLEAACSGQPTEFFFEERYEELAKEFCTGCPVKRRCYGWAQQQIQRGNLVYGIWGGRTWSVWVDDD